MRRLWYLLPIVGLLAVGTLTGCRTAPGVAAYVGDVTISTDRLAAAVDERMADDNIAAVVDPGDAAYQRVVLNLLVQQAIYQQLSVNYDLSYSDQAVDDRLAELLAVGGSSSTEEQYVRAATERSLAAIDVREVAQQSLVREGIAAAEGLDGPIQEPALQQRYEEVKSQLTTVELGVITVPDQATADAVLQAVLADPSSYEAVAETYFGPNTLPMPFDGLLSDVPAQLLSSVLATVVGQGFTVALAGIEGIVVGYVGSLGVPSFADTRDQIRAEALGLLDTAVTEIVMAFVSDLDIDVNPRYGSFDQGQIVPGSDGGVVRILEDAGSP